MLNFMVTEDGLQDQMLNEVVKHEDPKKMEQKNKIQIEQAEDNKTKALLEDDILGLIADNQKNLLEDDELIDKLDDSKLQCQAIDQKAEDAKITIDAIQNMRKHFEQVGRRVSRMFFVII
jgi:dynein heavy chain